MTWIVLLFGLGIVFLAIEVIIPGGILGAIGGLMMLGGCVVAFTEFGKGGGFMTVGVALALLALTVFLEFYVLPRTPVGKRAILTEAITGQSSAYDESAKSLIGRDAKAVTVLSPSGYVLIDGRRFEAFCDAGQVPSGTALTVTGADSFRLIVSLNQAT
jgi:membrane-bound ClpP family serine protease